MARKTIKQSATECVNLIPLVVVSSETINLDSCDAKIDVLVKNNEKIDLKIFAKGGKLKLRSKCEEGGELKLDGVFHTVDCDQDIDVECKFEEKDCKGDIILKGVAEGSSRINCKGVLEVEKGCKGFKGFLKEDFLMLDQEAQVDLVPGLEIKNDDVVVSHCASVKRIDPEDLFYLTSRGVSEKEAKEMVVEGFLQYSPS